MIEKQKWEEIGNLSKSIKNDLLKLKRLSAEVKMRKKEMGSLVRSTQQLDDFRSKAENFMFSRGEKDLTIFYGGDKK